MWAQTAQTRTSTVTPRQGFRSAAWHATRLSRDVLSRVVKLPKEVLLPREVPLPREAARPREAMRPREVLLPREAMRPREVVGSKHDEPSYLARCNRDRQSAGEVYVDMASSLVCWFLWFHLVVV